MKDNGLKLGDYVCTQRLVDGRYKFLTDIVDRVEFSFTKYRMYKPYSNDIGQLNNLRNNSRVVAFIRNEAVWAEDTDLDVRARNIVSFGLSSNHWYKYEPRTVEVLRRNIAKDNAVLDGNAEGIVVSEGDVLSMVEYDKAENKLKMNEYTVSKVVANTLGRTFEVEGDPWKHLCYNTERVTEWLENHTNEFVVNYFLKLSEELKTRYLDTIEKINADDITKWKAAVEEEQNGVRRSIIYKRKNGVCYV